MLVTDVLTADIADMFFDNREPEHMKHDKEEIRMLFEQFIKGDHFSSLMERLDLHVVNILAFGSSATPMATYSGDLDLCVWVKPILRKNRREYGKDEAKHILKTIAKGIQEKRIASHRFSRPILILGAKVPIIQIEINGFQVDISVHIGEREPGNTCAARILTAYHAFNPNFAPLCVYLKSWFKHVAENSQKNVEAAIPNSYTIVLLVAQFLQDKQLLPTLLSSHSEKFLPSTKIESITNLFPKKELQKYQKTAETQKPGVLLRNFLDYLISEVDLKNSVLVVNSASFVSKKSIKEEVKSKQVLAIDDVFDKFNPGRRVTCLDGFLTFLKEAKIRIENAQNPHRITDRLWSIQIDHRLIVRLRRTPTEVQTSGKKKVEKVQVETRKVKQENTKKIVRETMNFILNRVSRIENLQKSKEAERRTRPKTGEKNAEKV